mgnify:CR=1 FL=1
MSLTRTSPDQAHRDHARVMAQSLLAWYDRHRRDLPWRARPGETADPYRVWLSEIMLQQTTVAAVRDYFLRFVARWPDVEALASAPLDDILREWAGLGYYARARNLHKCAREVVEHHGGKFPQDVDALKGLPGIGAYTSAAIAAIAFDRPAAAVDGNVERVMARLFAVEEPLPDAKPRLKAYAESLVPQERAGDFAQALMDLGATVCAPRKANCLICPWSDPCQGRARGLAEELPRKRRKAKRPTRSGIAFWVERADGAVLLRRRPEEGLLGGMLEVPSSPWAVADEADASPVSAAPLAVPWQALPGRVEHTFTHFHLELEVWRAREPVDHEADGRAGYRWVARAELDGEALPNVMRKVVRHVLGADWNRPVRESGVASGE